MAQVDDEELGALRRRAYGPNADIDLDPHAVDRLRELEGAKKPQILRAPRDARAPSGLDEEQSPEPVVEPPGPVGAPPSRATTWLRRISRLRRSTILIGLAVLVIGAALATALTLIQRVQTDPLQTGADQIVRLQPSDAYPVPKIFGGSGVGSATTTQSYQAYYGLHVVISRSPLYFVGSANSTCLTVYPATAISDPQSESAAGPLMGGCNAGRFPAMTQFSTSIDGLPPALLLKFGRKASFQFVYDRVHREVVVFVDKDDAG